jgi:uncharacterized protein (DUF1501 family)
MKRRDFLKFLSVLSTYNILPSTLFANETTNDYKALVVILLHGGNDSVNMFIPTTNDTKSGFDAYTKARGVLAIKNNLLELPINNGELILEPGDKNPYYDNGSIKNSYTTGFYESGIDGIGINPLMPELAALTQAKKVAIVANMGTLHEPTSKEDILNKKVTLPLYLFSHNTQRSLFFTGNSRNQNSSGWAGVLADNLGDINSSDVYGLNISVSGTVQMMYGEETNPLTISSSGPTSYTVVKYRERELYDKLIQIQNSDEFLRVYNDIKKKSFRYQDILKADWDSTTLNFTSTTSYNQALFSTPNYQTLGISSDESIGSGLNNQLKTVAKLIQIAKNKGLKRQIFFVQQGGYDTHGNQTATHSKNLRELSLALDSFDKALQDMGVSNEVTTFNISDFGRSVGSNGDGSDHAWGGHYFVMGGAVKGGLYGTMPSLELGGEDDISKKGRLIPTIAHVQYYATLLKWFGVKDNLIETVLPELKNFSLKDLGFIRS